MVIYIKTIVSYFHVLIIALAGLISYVTMIPVFINYLLFYYVIPIVVIIIIIWQLCKKYDSSKIKKFAFLYVIFSILSFLCMIVTEKYIGGGIDNLDKNYYIFSLSGVFLIIAFISIVNFISLINNEKHYNFSQINQYQNQVEDDQIKNEELKK